MVPPAETLEQCLLWGSCSYVALGVAGLLAAAAATARSWLARERHCSAGTAQARRPARSAVRVAPGCAAA
eukprot:7668565-Pyramimonas_sp.AAC.1